MPTTIAHWRQRLNESRSRLETALSGVPDAAMTRPWRWRDQTDQVRYAFLRVVDDEAAALIEVQSTLAALNWRPPESARILALAEISRGGLSAMLVGVTDEHLDATPAPGEWPLRQVLAHIVITERRYYQRTAWHVTMARAGQATAAEPPPGVVEPMSETGLYARGTIADFRERLETAREETLAVLDDLTVQDMDGPTTWAGYQVDIRFRLHRFAAHEREHTGQVQAVLRAIGVVPSEAQRVLAAAHLTRGQLLATLVGVPDELVTQTPAGHDQCLADILARLADGEDARVASVLAALAT